MANEATIAMFQGRKAIRVHRDQLVLLEPQELLVQQEHREPLAHRVTPDLRVRMVRKEGMASTEHLPSCLLEMSEMFRFL